MKILGLFLSLICASQLASAETSSTSASTSTAAAADVGSAKKTVQTRADAEYSMGTVVTKGSLGDGERLNYTVFRPTLRGDFSFGLFSGITMPIAWITSGDNTQQRVMGRPQIFGDQVLVYNPGFIFAAGLAVRPPLYDTSYGNAEPMRAWQVAPGFKFDTPHIAGSRFHVFGGSTLFYDSQTSMTEQTPKGQLTYAFDPAMSLAALVGVGHKWEKSELALAVRTVNGLGNGHTTARLAVPKMGTFEQRVDMEPMDYMALVLSGDLDLDETTKLKGNITKSLKSNHFETAEAILATTETLPELTTLGAGLAVSKSF